MGRELIERGRASARERKRERRWERDRETDKRRERGETVRENRRGMTMISDTSNN